MLKPDKKESQLILKSAILNMNSLDEMKKVLYLSKLTKHIQRRNYMNYEQNNIHKPKKNIIHNNTSDSIQSSSLWVSKHQA